MSPSCPCWWSVSSLRAAIESTLGELGLPAVTCAWTRNGSALMKFYTTDTVVVPPMPPLASDQVSGLQVLSALRRNAYCAVPPRCLDEPVVKLPIAGQALILSCAPEVIRHVMMTQAKDYGKLPFGRRVLSPIVGRGLVVSEGESWRRQRRAMAPAFTPRNIASMARHIILCTERACNRLEESCGTEIDVLHEMRMLSLEIAATSMFSMEASTFGSELRAMVLEYTNTMGRLSIIDILLPDGVPTRLRARRVRFRRRPSVCSASS